MLTYLTDYPLEECNAACDQYMTNIDWDAVSQEVRENHVAYFDVSDAISIFGHLSLDEEYALYCYVTREYHGLWGRVAAVKKDAPVVPQNVIPKGVSGRLYGPSFELPDSSVPPMEAIYNDGTPYGYFESLLAEEFLRAIPYVRFEQDRWDNCITSFPENFSSEWNIYETLSDWSPYMITTNRGDVVISMCWRHFEHGIGGSDGCDRIRRAQHHFHDGMLWLLFAEAQENRRTMYKTHITDDKRYSEGRCCCVSTKRSITVAVQKDWRTLAEQRD